MNKATLLLTSAFGNINYQLPTKPKAIKLCLQCGMPHRHNNSFCSAKCCKSFHHNPHR